LPVDPVPGRKPPLDPPCTDHILANDSPIPPLLAIVVQITTEVRLTTEERDMPLMLPVGLLFVLDCTDLVLDQQVVLLLDPTPRQPLTLRLLLLFTIPFKKQGIF
jgi:hypothetical protein